MYFGCSLSFSTNLGVVYLAKSPAVSDVAIPTTFSAKHHQWPAFLTSEFPTLILVSDFVICYHP